MEYLKYISPVRAQLLAHKYQVPLCLLGDICLISTVGLAALLRKIVTRHIIFETC